MKIDRKARTDNSAAKSWRPEREKDASSQMNIIRKATQVHNSLADTTHSVTKILQSEQSVSVLLETDIGFVEITGDVLTVLQILDRTNGECLKEAAYKPPLVSPVRSSGDAVFSCSMWLSPSCEYGRPMITLQPSWNPF